jgi:hypothetical protein
MSGVRDGAAERDRPRRMHHARGLVDGERGHRKDSQRNALTCDPATFLRNGVVRSIASGEPPHAVSGHHVLPQPSNVPKPI